MLCERCKKNEAVVFYRENINGKEKKYSLCEDCKNEMERSGEIKLFDLGDSFFKYYSDPFDELGSIFGSWFALPNSAGARLASEAKKCPLCGATFSDIKRDGKLGCPECYETFANELEGTFGGYESSACEKAGRKMPLSHKAKADHKAAIKKLSAEMKEAISSENFEEAARIRDEIKKLKDEDSAS